MAADAVAFSPPPAWDKVPFAVGCARCGADLHGQAEPVCGACGLGFDWDEAVPIEKLRCLHCGYHLYGLTAQRCPECGEGFTWEAVLRDYYSKQLALFEYRWRDRPLKSFLGTFWRALRPDRLWRSISLHDPPQVVPLIAWVVLVGVASVVSHQTVCISIFIILGGADPRKQKRYESFLHFLGDSVLEYGRYLFSSSEVWSLVGIALAYGVFSFLTLMIFQQSMRRCRVRAAHVLRVWAYALPTMFLPAALMGLGMVYLTPVYNRGLDQQPTLVLLSLVLLHVCWSLFQGYRVYLKMPHALAVALVSQFLALLGLLSLLILLHYPPLLWMLMAIMR